MSAKNENVEYFVGCETSASGLKAVKINAAGDVLATSLADFSSDSDPVPQIAEFLAGLQEQFGHFEKIGIAIPGLVEKEAGRVAYSASISVAAARAIAADIETATNTKLTIENDANAAAYAEFKLGAGRGSRSMFYATLGDGVGGAFIFDGEIWRGVSGFAGEFGYVAINSDGTRLEDVASAANIARRTRNRFNQDNTSALGKITDREIKFEDIISAAKKKDEFAQLMLERTGTYVGTAIATVINLLNVDKIVVGGEVMKAGARVLGAINSRAKELSFAPSFNDTSIVAGELGDFAASIGIALIAADSNL